LFVQQEQLLIPKDACRFFEFEKADEMIEIGRSKAGETLSHLHDM
jgi:hypothetical protein